MMAAHTVSAVPSRAWSAKPVPQGRTGPVATRRSRVADHPEQIRWHRQPSDDKTARVNTLPPSPGPLPLPDPRAHDVVLDYAGMHALVADLVLPGDASMYVMSAMET